MQRSILLPIGLGSDVTAVRERCRRGLEAGFDGVELVTESLISPATAHQYDALLDEIRKFTKDQLPVLAVAAKFETTDVEEGSQALSGLLEWSAALGAKCLNLTIPPLRARNTNRGFNRYQDAVNFAHQMLRGAQMDSVAAGVALAIEPAKGGVLLSPVELREMIDDANHTGSVGVCIDVERVAEFGCPADWLATLSYRVQSVRIYDLFTGTARDSNRFHFGMDGEMFSTALASVPADRPLIAMGNESAESLRGMVNLD